MKFLITGGAGFIGSAVIKNIINNTSDSVLNLDKLTYAGNLESLADVSGSRRYEFVRGDVCDKALLSNIFARFKPDIVMHLAAESHVDRSIDGPGEFIQTNIVGTYALLEEARNYLEFQGSVYTIMSSKMKNFQVHWNQEVIHEEKFFFERLCLVRFWLS